MSGAALLPSATARAFATSGLGAAGLPCGPEGDAFTFSEVACVGASPFARARTRPSVARSIVPLGSRPYFICNHWTEARVRGPKRPSNGPLA